MNTLVIVWLCALTLWVLWVTRVVRVLAEAELRRQQAMDGARDKMRELLDRKGSQ